jgi:hypothetical protein
LLKNAVAAAMLKKKLGDNVKVQLSHELIMKMPFVEVK